MITQYAFAFTEQQFRNTMCAPVQIDELDQDKLCPLSWSGFLVLLECYCRLRGWDIEYGDVTDYSCAIFAWEDTLPATFDDNSEEAADETHCLWQQLPLF